MPSPSRLSWRNRDQSPQAYVEVVPTPVKREGRDPDWRHITIRLGPIHKFHNIVQSGLTPRPH